MAVLAQFDYNHFGVQTNTLNNLLTTYADLGATGSDGNALSQLGGNSHIWSFTLDPMYTYMDRDKIGGYVIGGVGFYHKVTDFTTPAIGDVLRPITMAAISTRPTRPSTTTLATRQASTAASASPIRHRASAT